MILLCISYYYSASWDLASLTLLTIVLDQMRSC